jgi:hypothetical protein
MKGDVKINDDSELEKEADVMGAKASNSINGVHQLKEKTINNNTEGATIQRAIINTPPVITENLNVAHSWKGGGDYAVTPSIINGKEIPPTSNKEGLIHSLGFDFIDLGEDDKAHRFQLQLIIPNQNVGYRLDLPTDGPWHLPSAKVKVIDAFIGLDGLKTPQRTEEEDELECILILMPDGDLKGQIRNHEMHHVDEQQQAIDEILVPWDQLLQASKIPADQLTNRGPLELLADYGKIGPKKTSQEVADELVSRLKELGEAYHETDHGKPPVVSRFELRKNVNTYIVWLKLENT